LSVKLGAGGGNGTGKPVDGCGSPGSGIEGVIGEGVIVWPGVPGTDCVEGRPRKIGSTRGTGLRVVERELGPGEAGEGSGEGIGLIGHGVFTPGGSGGPGGTGFGGGVRGAAGDGKRGSGERSGLGTSMRRTGSVGSVRIGCGGIGGNGTIGGILRIGAGMSRRGRRGVRRGSGSVRRRGIFRGTILGITRFRI
jgi:hypothetical protein